MPLSKILNNTGNFLNWRLLAILKKIYKYKKANKE